MNNIETKIAELEKALSALKEEYAESCKSAETAEVTVDDMMDNAYYRQIMDPDKYPIYYIDFNGDICQITSASMPHAYDNEWSNYLSKRYAEIAKEAKIFTDKLLAFKWCYDREFEFNATREDLVWSIVYESASGRYTSICKMYPNSPTDIVFSTDEIAKKCADWLNSMEGEDSD